MGPLVAVIGFISRRHNDSGHMVIKNNFPFIGAHVPGVEGKPQFYGTAETFGGQDKILLKVISHFIDGKVA